MPQARLVLSSAVALLVIATVAPMSHGSGITFVKYVTDVECCLYTIDPASQTPRLLLDLTAEVFGRIKDPASSSSDHWLAVSGEGDLLMWRSGYELALPQLALPCLMQGESKP